MEGGEGRGLEAVMHIASREERDQASCLWGEGVAVIHPALVIYSPCLPHHPTTSQHRLPSSTSYQPSASFDIVCLTNSPRPTRSHQIIPPAPSPLTLHTLPSCFSAHFGVPFAARDSDVLLTRNEASPPPFPPLPIGFEVFVEEGEHLYSASIS